MHFFYFETNVVHRDGEVVKYYGVHYVKWELYYRFGLAPSVAMLQERYGIENLKTEEIPENKCTVTTIASKEIPEPNNPEWRWLPAKDFHYHLFKGTMVSASVQRMMKNHFCRKHGTDDLDAIMDLIGIEEEQVDIARYEKDYVNLPIEGSQRPDRKTMVVKRAKNGFPGKFGWGS